MMQSGRAALAISGLISGSGLASAKIKGLVPMLLTISALTTPGAEHPKKTSAPTMASASVRSEVFCA